MQTYRSDVDGLRAVAILPVVFFHAGILGFSGGYVGVDVFFVISGYLITSIVFDDLGKGRFSIARFYERRVRRIIPALFAVILFAILCSLAFLIPYDMEQFARSVVATVLFGSNMFFWATSGYFTGPALSKPLLHTWSLAVEEQFYIFFPPLLYLLFRFAKPYIVPVFIGLGVVSLIAAQYCVINYTTPAFYLFPLRAWELLLGCVLGTGQVPVLRSRVGKEILAWAGLAGILYPVFAYSSETAFPGLSALPVCVGTAALIFANTGAATTVGTVLSLRPIVFIGLISYSLYLWHWPFVVFGRIAFPDSGPLYPFALVAVSVIAAILSWRYVERPFRGSSGAMTRKQIFSVASAAAVVLAGFAGAGMWAHGWPSRYSPAVNHMANYLKYPKTAEFKRTEACFDDRAAKFDPARFTTCLSVKPNRKNVILWGDSHSWHYEHGLAAAARQSGYEMLEASFARCQPAIGHVASLPPGCVAFNKWVLERIEQKHPDAVVLSAHWLHGNRTVADTRKVFLSALSDMLSRLQSDKIPVILVGPSIEFEDPLPLILARRLADGKDPSRVERSSYRAGLFELDSYMQKQFSGRPGVIYISVIKTTCPDGDCPVLLPGEVPMQWDQSHLTVPGSDFMASKIFPPAFAKLKK